MKKLSIKNVKKLSRTEMKQIMAGSGTPVCGNPCYDGNGCGGASDGCNVCIGYGPFVCGTPT